MQRTLRTHHYTAVFFIDLDRFKAINDGAGHEVGDEVLRQLSQRLRESVREHDTVARYGGDEFVVVAEELAWPNEALEVGERLVQQVSRPVAHTSGDIIVKASIGAAVTEGSMSPQDVLRDADSAMYRAKQRGGNTVVWTQIPSA